MSGKTFRHIFLQKLSPKHYFSERMIPDTTDSNRTDPGYRFGSVRFGKFYRYLPILLMIVSLLSPSIGSVKVRFGHSLHPRLPFTKHLKIFGNFQKKIKNNFPRHKGDVLVKFSSVKSDLNWDHKWYLNIFMYVFEYWKTHFDAMRTHPSLPTK